MFRGLPAPEFRPARLEGEPRKLDQPQNLWGLEGCPDDWKRWLVTEIFSDQSPRADLRVSKNLNSLVTQLLGPLQTEVMELREKLAQGTAKRRILRSP